KAPHCCDEPYSAAVAAGEGLAVGAGVAVSTGTGVIGVSGRRTGTASGWGVATISSPPLWSSTPALYVAWLSSCPPQPASASAAMHGIRVCARARAMAILLRVASAGRMSQEVGLGATG